jgi:hypothetical protein
MAIELKNSVFIHIPKCGGRKITNLLLKYVDESKIIGDRVYDAHGTPDTDKQVFAFVRHPATFIHSLWNHRSRKKSNYLGDQWNWQMYLRLEKECGSSNYETFVNNIVNGKNYILDYYEYYTKPYQNVQYGKMENLIEDLIFILNTNNEKFDEDGIRKDVSVLGSGNKKTNKPVSTKDSMTKEQLNKLVNKSERELCERFGYYEI